MGNSLLRDFKDDRDTVEIFHRRDWVKREPPDELIFSRLELMLTEVATHVDSIEAFLENGSLAEGKSFIRPQERPAVGDGALGHELLRTLQHRLLRVEQSLGERLQAETK
jgi:hypothetical protein